MKQIAATAGANGALSREPKGKTQTPIAKNAVKSVIHQGDVGGKSNATQTPTTNGDESLKVAVVLKSFLPKNSKTAQVTTEIATVMIAETPWIKIATTRGTQSIKV